MKSRHHPKLSVNVNKIATLRNARGGEVPHLTHCVETLIAAGAQSITAHPRADRRHITPHDIHDLYVYIHAKNTELSQRGLPLIETNWEGDLREEFLALVSQYPPSQCTLVPVSYGELTSHRGYDVKTNEYLLRPTLSHLKSLGIRTSVFVGVLDHDSITRLAQMDCDRIEIYTQPYAVAFTQGAHQLTSALANIAATTQTALDCKLQVNAGHDLNLANIPPLLQAVPQLSELSVGHHLIAHALQVGLTTAVQDYLAACQSK